MSNIETNIFPQKQEEKKGDSITNLKPEWRRHSIANIFLEVN
jgi:hypothetical protein